MKVFSAAIQGFLDFQSITRIFRNRGILSLSSHTGTAYLKTAMRKLGGEVMSGWRPFGNVILNDV